ncbi:MAG: CPBP family intramembrane metalloprotease [Spirochaetia bacterium]|nr:CPBP family intramembrane metalloprotease [Spirochaetia bacterium]
MDRVTRTQGSRVGYFFLITFLFSWSFWGLGVLHALGVLILPFPPLVIVGIGAHGPLVAALWLRYRTGGRTGVISLLKSGFTIRMKAIWWIAILLLPSVFAGLALWLRMRESTFLPDTPLLDQPLLIIPTFLFLFFLGGSFQEEFGWRGCALPILLKRWSPLAASLILGTFWGIWHLPLFFITGLSQTYMHFGIFFLLSEAFSILFTGVYLLTGNNLFSALLLHTAINTSLSLFPPIEQRSGGDRRAMVYLMLIYGVAAIMLILLRPALRKPGGFEQSAASGH